MYWKFCAMAELAVSGLDCAKAEETNNRQAMPGANKIRFIWNSVVLISPRFSVARSGRTE